LSERVGTGLQRRDTLDEFAAQWKSNRDANNINAPGVIKPYRDHAWVYAAVTAIARNVAQVPFKLWVGETELSEEDPLVRLFKRPNPLLSGYELFYSTECYLQLTGNALWVPVPSKLPGVIAELWVFSGKEIKPKIANNTFTGWTVKRGDMEETFQYDEVIHFRYFNPYNPVLGMAPMEAARLAVDQSWWAQKYNEAFFQNFAEPGVIISFPGDYNAKVMQASRESWDQRHQGFNRAKKTAILWGGAELKELGTTKRDMEFIAQMKWGREEVLAVFHVPPVEVMLVDQVSSRVESQRAQRRLFGEEVVAPELKMFEDKLLPLFTMIGRPEVRGWFDTTEVSILQESYGEKIEQAKKLFDMLIPINMIVEKLDLGFEHIAWGDEAFVANNLIPASKAMLAEAPVDEPDDEDEPVPDDDESDEPADPDDDEPTEVETSYTLGPRARKLRRVLFEVRNETLKEKDGLGLVDWARVQRRLEPLVCNAPGVTERLKDWSDRASKDQIRIAYSRLKNQVGKLVSPDVVKPATQKQLPPKQLEFTSEVPDMDGYWRSYEREILRHEQRMESVLVKYFNQWERHALSAWSNANQGAGVRDGDWNEFDPNETGLANAVTPVLSSTMQTMGTCALTMPPVETIPTVHIPQNKADRSLAVKETKELVKLLGGKLSDNNANTDILVGKNAVEVKAITARKNDRVINMSPATKTAKLEYLQQNGLTGHTVVLDLREGKKLIYYSEGIGSRSLGQMRVVTEAELKKLINWEGAVVEAKTAPVVKQGLIKDASVNKGYADHLEAAKKWMKTQNDVSDNQTWNEYSKKFLKQQGFEEKHIKEYYDALDEWVGSSRNTGGGKMIRSASKWLGRDPDKEWGTSTKYFYREVETTQFREMVGAIKALNEEYFEKHMKRSDGNVYRGVKGHNAELERSKSMGGATFGVNSLSSWSVKTEKAKGFGVMLSKPFDRSSVYVVLPGWEREIIAMHERHFVELGPGNIVIRAKKDTKKITKDTIVIFLDAEDENADWIK